MNFLGFFPPTPRGLQSFLKNCYNPLGIRVRDKSTVRTWVWTAVSFLYPQCWWGHVRSAKSSPGLPSTDKLWTNCNGSSTSSEILLWNGAAACPRGNSRYCNLTSVPPCSSQPPCARDGCYPAQAQQGWPAASHCKANEGASSSCSLLLAARWAHQGYSLPRWEIKWEWQLLSRFYTTVGSWPGVEGKDVKCCGSKSSRQANTEGLCFPLSLRLSSHKTRVAKALQALPPTLICLLLPFSRLCSEPWDCISPWGGTQCLSRHSHQHKVPYKTRRPGGHSVLVMAGTQSSQHSLPLAISTIFSPYIGLKYAKKN